MKKNLLLTPGPTIVPENIREVLALPIIHHRTPQFQDNLKEAIEGLKFVFQTKNDIYLLASSGTGAMEASVCNLLSPGDQAITVESGKFGERWTELCKAYGADAKVLSVKWGTAVKADQIKELLDKEKNVKAVFITLCETSTGVGPDIKAIADVVRKTSAVLVVDAVSGLGVVDLQTDNWGVDVVASASHKGFMLPPGLAFISVSDKAFAMMEKATSPRYYFDLRKSKKAAAKIDTPFTPAIGLVIALNESLKFFKEKGLADLFAHYEQLAKTTRKAAQAIGLTLYPQADSISNVLTAINVPEGIDGGKLVKIMRDTYGISIAGGQGELKGKIIRIAHMGCVDKAELLEGFTILEKVLKELGHTFKEGASLEVIKRN